jgi:uncharacterized protein (TIGR00645 family)
VVSSTIDHAHDFKARKITRVEAMTTPGRKLEYAFEGVLFASRWILAPFYLGMAIALIGILVVFAREEATELAHLHTFDGEHVLLFALSLIDLSLTGNLVLIVIFAGYENFISRMHVTNNEDRPKWMGTVDFSGLKIKLVASIIAISAIALLRAFLPLGEPEVPVDESRLRWMVIIHLTFVASGVLLSTMDWIASKTSVHDSSSP